MRFIFIILISLFGHILSSQDCIVCPDSTVYLHASDQPEGTVYTWNCTNGFTASAKDTFFTVEYYPFIIDCTLLMELNGSSISSSVQVRQASVIPETSLIVDGCQLVRSGTTCETFRLMRSNTLGGVATVVMDSPPLNYTPTQTGWYRIDNICECWMTSTPAVYFYKADISYVGSCVLIDGGSFTPHTCNVWEVQKRCGGEGSPWETYQTGVTGPVYVNEDGCCWRYICDASTGLNNYCSDIECITAPGCAVDSCALDISISLIGCSSLAISWPVCTGSWEIQDSVAGVWSAIVGGVGTPPTSYVLTGDGFYRAVKVCSPCTYTSATIDVGCYPPPCLGSTVEITQTPDPCEILTTLTTEVSDCEGVPNYLWNTGATTANLANVGSGTYTVTVTGCCTDPITDTYVVNCPPEEDCDDFTAILTFTDSIVCVGTINYLEVTPTGGTAPYTYEWRRGLATIVSDTSIYSYTATFGTIVLTITITDAEDCEFIITRAFATSACCDYSIATTGTQVVCNNTNVTWTAVPTGGTGPYVYEWTLQRPDLSYVAYGTGATKTFNLSTVGLYQVLVASHNNGCSAFYNRSLTIVDCNTCDCSQSLVLSGCNLNASFSGNCSGYSYQLQYSPSGSGWTPIQTGIPSNFSYTPTENGIYRMLLFKTGCTTLETAPVSVNCVVSCTCIPSAPVNNGCNITFGGCSGYTATLQQSIEGLWTDITTSSPYTLPLSDLPSYDGLEGGTFRVAYTKSGCPAVFSSSLLVDGGDALVDVTRDLEDPNFAPYYWLYAIELFGGDLDNELFTCIGDNDRGLYGTSRIPTDVATPPNFYTNTFTSTIPVTWSFTHIIDHPTSYVWVETSTSNELVLKFQNVAFGDPTSGIHLCTGVFQSQIRYGFIITATDSCGREIYRAYCVHYVAV